MNTSDHAREIYTSAIAARIASGKPAPSATEAPNWADMAILLAKIFEERLAKS